MSEPLAETPALPPTLLGTTPPTETPKADSPVEGAKPPEGDKPAEGDESPEAPAPFDFTALKLPEGMTLPDDAKSAFSEIVTANKLPTETAQALMDLYAKNAQASAAAQAKVWTDMNEAWQAEVKADKDIGGDKFPEVQQTIAKVFDDPAIGAPGIREALNLTGAGNNPAVVRTIYNLAKIATEGKHIGGGPGESSTAPQNLGEALYGAGGPKRGR